MIAYAYDVDFNELREKYKHVYENFTPILCKEVAEMKKERSRRFWRVLDWNDGGAGVKHSFFQY